MLIFIWITTETDQAIASYIIGENHIGKDRSISIVDFGFRSQEGENGKKQPQIYS